MTSVIDDPTPISEDGLKVSVFEDVSPSEPSYTDEHARLLSKFRFKSLYSEGFPSVPYPRLSGYELHVTMAFLPTAYKRTHWHEYEFDVIPLSALKALEAADSLGVFSDFEIWTPEKPKSPPRTRNIDPMLVGVAGGQGRFSGSRSKTWMYRGDCSSSVQFFPIARWGEALKSFSEMKRAVKSNMWHPLYPTCSGTRMVRIVRREFFCLMCGNATTVD